jgi:hypothetical protein
MEVDAEVETLSAVATPLLLIVAALVLDEIQVTASVTTSVVPSSSVAVATKSCVSPDVIDAVVGVIAIDLRFARVIDTVVAPLIEPDAAVMLEVPAETPVTTPALVTVATDVSDEVHVAELVNVFVLPSLYVPVATIC